MFQAAICRHQDLAGMRPATTFHCGKEPDKKKIYIDIYYIYIYNITVCIYFLGDGSPSSALKVSLKLPYLLMLVGCVSV